MKWEEVAKYDVIKKMRSGVEQYRDPRKACDIFVYGEKSTDDGAAYGKHIVFDPLNQYLGYGFTKNDSWNGFIREFYNIE